MPRKKIVRAADLPEPGRVSDEDFDHICVTANIPIQQQSVVRAFLDECVAAFAGVVAAAETHPTRKSDRLAIERAVRDIRQAQHRLKRRPGPAGRLGLRAAGRGIGPIVAASWMRDRFPGDGAAPDPYFWPPEDRSIRQPSRSPLRPTDVDELSLGARIGFMERRAGEAIAALLGDIADALEVGRRTIVRLPDGRKPLEHRAYLLAALAELWHHLGRRPASGITSQFGAFCETVFDAIGWPAQGVNAALADAIRLWHRLYR